MLVVIAVVIAVAVRIIDLAGRRMVCILRLSEANTSHCNYGAGCKS